MTIQLPRTVEAAFTCNSRGNTLLVNEEQTIMVAVILIEDDQARPRWLLIEYHTQNYPPLEVTCRRQSPHELAKLLHRLYSGCRAVHNSNNLPLRLDTDNYLR